ncbi:hypothetical protein HNQ50_003039 [Silvimonas terrae]|uniref:DUF4007 domain-containing protein n=1 Tax=Silvimonas terrae TaxID=300266 RepID=A0A840RIF3_9NEIS|nr:DUF4007 family protein [Silvimonas terrae]MBB5192298.1 hypothetical protein [Silvimonas terrae]
MTIGSERTERFSGHESFVCRYGWLPKIYRAVLADARVLRNEEQAMVALGIGRNMVKSLQFWAEATGVIRPSGEGGHAPGPVGGRLFGDLWDPYLEAQESLWLIHWQLTTRAGLAAWSEVFGEGGTIRFDRARLIQALGQRSAPLVRALAPSTLEQHASIFIQSYLPSEKNADDTAWCPLQDLGLLKAMKTEDGRILYSTDVHVQVGLTPRVFALALVDFLLSQQRSGTADFHSLLKGAHSPGVVFRLSEHQLRVLLERTMAEPLRGALRFVDTADTQSIVLKPTEIDPQFKLWQQEEALENV